MRIVVDVMHMRAEYWYRWVDDPVATVGGATGTTGGSDEDDEWELISRPNADQVVRTNADENPGETSVEIKRGIFEDLTEGGLFVVVPIAVVSVGGFVVARQFLRKRKKNGTDQESKDTRRSEKEKEERKEPKSYRMVVSKDFGAGLRPGVAREVRVRIEEIRKDEEGVLVGRPVPELTYGVRPEPLQNLELVEAKFSGYWEDKSKMRYVGDRDMRIVIRVPVTDALTNVPASPELPNVPDAPNVSIELRSAPRNLPKVEPLKLTSSDDRPPILELSYQGIVGTFRNQISFKLLDEPQIAFVARDGRRLGEKSHVMDLLMDDEMGSELFFVAEHFSFQPKVVDIPSRDPDVWTTYERWPSLDKGDAFGYKVTVCNRRLDHPQFGFDVWPLTSEGFVIKLEGPEESLGERAVAQVTCHIWSEGLSFDGRLLDEGDWAGGYIRVDTSKYVTKDVRVRASAPVGSAEYGWERSEDLRIRPIELGTCVAYKDNFGDVCVDKPDVPQMPRLEPADRATFDMFGSEDPRFWYELQVSDAPLDDGGAYRNFQKGSRVDERTGSLRLEPLLPMVVDAQVPEYHAVFESKYEKGGRSFSAKVLFAITGVRRDVQDEERTVEIERITRLFAVMQLRDIERVRQIFVAYGPAAEKACDNYGTYEDTRLLGRTTDELLMCIAEIQSVRRLQVIRHALMDVHAEYQQEQKAIQDSRAKWFTFGYFLATTVRYACDMALSACFTLLLKEKGAIIEPIILPIKELAVEYCVQLGDWYVTEREWNPITFVFDDERILTALLNSVESTLFSLLAMAILDHGKTPITKTQACSAFGSIAAFVFAKNCRKYTEYDPHTKSLQVRMWAALKGTMADLTVQILKIIVAGVVARMFKRIMTPLGELMEENKSDEGPLGKLAKAYREMTSGPESAKFFAEVSARNKNLMSDRSFSAWYRNFIGPKDAIPNQGTEYIDLVKDAYKTNNDALIYLCDILGNTFIDAARATDDMVLDVEGKLDELALNFGDVTVSFTNDKGHIQQEKVPLLAAVFVFVNKGFAYLGLDRIHLDLDEVLPKDMPYKTRKQMVDLFNDIPGGMRTEKEFITKPERQQKPYAASVGLGFGVDIVTDRSGVYDS